MPIFVHYFNVFSIKICKKNQLTKSSKHDFGDARGDEKQGYYLEWPYHQFGTLVSRSLGSEDNPAGLVDMQHYHRVEAP